MTKIVKKQATKDAFELLHYIVGKRLKNGLLTVVDATNVQVQARKILIQLAREYHILPIAIARGIEGARDSFAKFSYKGEGDW